MSESYDIIKKNHQETYSKKKLDYDLDEASIERAARSEGSVKLTVCGSPEQSLEQNQAEYGQYIAERVADKLKKAVSENKRLVLDMATGSSPVPIWQALEDMTTRGAIDFGQTIFMGHEQGWGDIKPGSIVDFDGDREKTIESFGINIQPITSAEQLFGEEIEGNYLQMNLDSSPQIATLKFRTNLSYLKARSDVKFFGLYGVGTDGHVDEMQIDTMGMRASFQRQDVFLDLDPGVMPAKGVQFNSYERGFHKWRKPGAAVGDPDEFQKENNVFWYRGKSKDELYGRPAEQDATFGGVDHIMGLGWRDLLHEDDMILMFNNKGKSLALQLALEGSFPSEIIDNESNSVLKVAFDKGIGEKVLPEMQVFAAELTSQGILDLTEVLEASRCADIFQAIYLGLDEIQASSQDPRYIPVFEQLWRYMNDYVGRRAPVSILIKLRHMLGRNTELVVVPEVIKDTKYETLIERPLS